MKSSSAKRWQHTGISTLMTPSELPTEPTHLLLELFRTLLAELWLAGFWKKSSNS